MFIIELDKDSDNTFEQPTLYIKDTETGYYVAEIFGHVDDPSTLEIVRKLQELFNK